MVKAYEIAHRAMRFTCRFGGMLGIALGVIVTAAHADDAPFVKLAPATAGASQLERVFFGKVVARATVDLAFQVSGQIVELSLDEGAAVSKGSALARMDLEPFELALEQAQANEDQARRTVERFEKLAGSSVAETNLEDGRTTMTIADVALRDAQRNLEHATLVAPFDGIVASRLVPNFSTVTAGTPIVRLHDLSELRIEIDVPETLFQRAGQDPNVVFTAQFPASDRSFPLEVREYNAETAEIGQTYSITLGMPLPEDLIVLPGSSVEVTAVLQTGGQSLEVPTSAVVIGNDNETYVMVFGPTGASRGTVTRTPITIEPTNRGTAQVVEGLSDGQEIVVSGASALADGTAVRRFIGFGD